MKFKAISIKNFRNFEDITITLDNKNVFFGMNDVGKTNFLYALRYLFDREVRKRNLINTDFYRKNTENPIEIMVSIDISDVTDSDSEKIRAKAKGVLLSKQYTVYIKLIAQYNRTEMIADIELLWGGDKEDLQPIKLRGYTFDIDNLFNVIYIDAYVDLYGLFKKNISTLLKNDDEQDKQTLDEINKEITNLNENISSLSGIKNFEKELTPIYGDFRHDDIEVSIKSELAVNGLYSNVVPYIKNKGSEELYPTAGEGRKKLLVYAIYDILAREKDESQINLFLIEEPENHLHRAMQAALSQRIFIEETFKYIFLTAHSSYILEDMDNVNLVRIFNRTKVDSASSFYKVPQEFKQLKRQLNKGLVEAIFADKVLLVEGPSEEVLFEKVLSMEDSYYQVNGVYVLATNGIDFRPYVKILRELQIPYIVKTDNDLRKSGNESGYKPIGFSRINHLIEKDVLSVNCTDGNSAEDKRKLYDMNKNQLDLIRKEHHIYLSKVSLEEDLDEAIHERMVQYLPDADGNVVDYLKDHKKYNMIELVQKLTHKDCDMILHHYNFACLEEILK